MDSSGSQQDVSAETTRGWLCVRCSAVSRRELPEEVSRESREVFLVLYVHGHGKKMSGRVCVV